MFIYEVGWMSIFPAIIIETYCTNKLSCIYLLLAM